MHPILDVFFKGSRRLGGKYMSYLAPSWSGSVKPETKQITPMPACFVLAIITGGSLLGKVSSFSTAKTSPR